MAADMPVRGLPEIFESFIEARREGFISIKELKEAGHGAAGFFCGAIPAELFIAAGIVPVWLVQNGGERVDGAETKMPPGLCPMVRGVVASAVTDTCPYMYFTDLIVGERSCPGKDGMYEALKKIKNVHVMKLPRGESAGDLWLKEMKSLKKKIEEKFQVTISETKLREAIRKRNRERALFNAVCELSLLEPPPITGLRQLQILYGAQFRFNHGEKVRELEETISRIKEAYAAGKRRISKRLKRIALAGCPMGGAAEKITRIVEDSGGVVVVNETCAGVKLHGSPVSQTGDPWEALRDYYLETGCCAGGSGPSEELCARFAAGGIIRMALQACGSGAGEARARQDKTGGVPVLFLEGDFFPGDTARLKTRIAAFIEKL